jgi:L-alanine-DL-glutamate epimerase-like enolase superfamily enzyme
MPFSSAKTGFHSTIAPCELSYTSLTRLERSDLLKLVERSPENPIERFQVWAYTIPTESPEADGTIEWNQTTIVLVQLCVADTCGLGYSFAHTASAHIADSVLKPLVLGRSAFAIPAIWSAMVRAVRNLGRPGVGAMAISAVDNALWDLKARLFHVSVADLLGRARDAIPAYGSGGFTSYSVDQFSHQLRGWTEQGIRAVKMKIGADSAADPARVRTARAVIGPDAELFVDANGAYDRQEAVIRAHQFADCGVTWFEEPVSSDDLEGLRFIREHAPPGMRIAAGEYGFDSIYFRRMLEAGAVDVLQADATRCAGITGFLAAGAIADAFTTPFSAHTAPSLHTHACCAVTHAINVEYFFDHYRIERIFFDGAIEPVNGMLRPDSARPGFGLECKWPDIKRYQVYGNAAE